MISIFPQKYGEGLLAAIILLFLGFSRKPHIVFHCSGIILYSCTLDRRVPVSAVHPPLPTPSRIGYLLSVSFRVAPVVGSSECTAAFPSNRSKLLLKHPLIPHVRHFISSRALQVYKVSSMGWGKPPQLRALVALAEA